MNALFPQDGAVPVVVKAAAGDYDRGQLTRDGTYTAVKQYRGRNRSVMQGQELGFRDFLFDGGMVVPENSTLL